MSHDKSRKVKPIDEIRDSASMMDIETNDDNTPIFAFINNGDKLLVVKGRGIYEIKLADQIDPARTNINTPNTAQRVFQFGSDTPWVGAIILTADQLFNSSCFSKVINKNEAILLVLNMSEFIASLYQQKSKYKSEIEELIKKTEMAINQNRSFIVPAMGNLSVLCHEFVIKADHAMSSLFSLAHLFYPEFKDGNWEVFKRIIDNEHLDDNFSDFLERIIPVLKDIRNTRNCAEHPTNSQKMIVCDFILNPDNTLVPPTIEIVHKDIKYNKTLINDYFEEIFESIVIIAESMIAFLSERRSDPIAGMEVHVIELDANQRRHKSARYKYGAVFNGQLLPIG